MLSVGVFSIRSHAERGNEIKKSGAFLSFEESNLDSLIVISLHITPTSEAFCGVERLCYSVAAAQISHGAKRPSACFCYAFCLLFKSLSVP